MRRVPHQRHAVGGIAFGQGQRQWIAEARPRQRQIAQEIAKARPQDRQEGGVVQGGDGRGVRGGFRPDDVAAVAGQGQDRQRPGRHEILMRDALMGQGMVDGRDQRGLAVIPALAPDARARGHARPAPVRTDQQPGRQPLSVRQDRGDTRRADLLAGDGQAGQGGDSALHRIGQGGVQEAVLQHMAHRAFAQLGAVEMQEEMARALSGLALGRLDLVDGLGVGGQPVPQAKRPQHADRGDGKRIGPPVETCPRPRARGARIDHGHAQPGLGQRQRQGRAVQPAPGHHDVEILCHGPQLARAVGKGNAARGLTRPGPAGRPARSGNRDSAASRPGRA